MSFSQEVKAQAMIACGRSCCICHEFKGVKLELHHILLQSEGGLDDFDNAIPLCFDCHAEQSSYDKKHPKGTKYSSKELRQHRDNWYARVERNKSGDASKYASLDLETLATIKSHLPWDGMIFF